jgi:hypothetical protein
MQELCGWIDNQPAVESVLAELPYPLFSSAGRELLNQSATDDPVLLYDIFREVIKSDPPSGPQAIGDCVSWGWGNLVNYVAAVQIHQQLKSGQLTAAEAVALIEEYQEACTEAIYALSRVEVGGQRGSRSDGSVGAWAAKAVSTYGTLSRKKCGPYSGQRAKDWGASGLPDNLEPEAKQHLIKTVSQVKSFDEAFAAIGNGYPVAVCSNQGFTMTRDSEGFCSPSGRWDHCMLFMARRSDRPGLCCSQSWGPKTPQGPLALNQPGNTFWVDAKVADRMLGQGDSFTGSQFQGYEAQDLVSWKH